MDKIFKNILCPTDLSPNSETAYEKAIELASMFGAKLLIAHIISNPFSQVYGDPSNRQISLEEVKEIAEEKTKAFAEKHAPAVPYGILVKNHEHTYKGIIECVQENDVDLILMATRGISGPKRILLGSVAETIVRLAPCSVLVVRPTSQK